MAGLTQVPQGRTGPSHIESRHRQGPQHTSVEQFGELEHPLVHPGTARLEEVEGAVADARILPGDHAGVTDVGLTHLQEHAAGRDQAKRRVDEFTGQRVQHDIHAAPTSDRAELLLELEAARVPDVVFVKAHGPQGVPLAAAGGTEHFEP
ncbi:hypothetical protein MmonteBS_36300 [Mycobacterium montefiorense]|uniref:Uncharacterized protein n=1 Tax=Mycobacterium montefiorense TaxID=154654 RepID=A0ABQ0NR14_9MYCO|nr:hypothetical protein MmonteBS_36300 [Mycobacterium montefiorense]GKU45622.1 hypothetical protein NJB14194_22430 [Mycobacterium montefiorense]